MPITSQSSPDVPQLTEGFTQIAVPLFLIRKDKSFIWNIGELTKKISTPNDVHFLEQR